jgi:hypothetical protein
MADPYSLRVPRQPDRSIVSLFKELAKKAGVDSIKLNVGAAGNIQVPVSTEEEPEELQTLLEANSSLIESASVGIPGFGISFHRGGRGKAPPDRSPFFDDIAFAFSNQQCQLSEGDRLSLITHTAKALGPFDPNRSVGGGLSEEQQQLISIHSSTLDRLETLNEELIRKSEDFRQRLENQHQERADELETKHQERSQHLQEEFDKKRKELESREDKIREKLKEIDDRQNTHVRRELRKSIIDEIRSRSEDMSLTENTSRLRWPIHGVCILLMVLLGAGSVYYAIELGELVRANDITNWSIVATLSKQLLVSISLGATAVFYIRWLNSWFSEHANNEFRLRQLQLDFERASWVVETAFEWKGAEGSTIPNELLEPISKNLFSPGDNLREDMHPADQLASALLGTASVVRLKSGDSELELDGKRLAKANGQAK